MLERIGLVETPLQVKSVDVAVTGEIDAYIREKVAGLEHLFDGIISCRATIEGPTVHHRGGGPYKVIIDVLVPGAELVVSGTDAERLHPAIGGAFSAMRTQLVKYVERRKDTRRGRVAPPEGRIAQLFQDAGYGFIETDDARSLYFHRNSVLDSGFDELNVGTRVRFAEEIGDEGPQATTVVVVS